MKKQYYVLYGDFANTEIYSRIELVEYNWTEKQEYPLAQLTFLA